MQKNKGVFIGIGLSLAGLALLFLRYMQLSFLKDMVARGCDSMGCGHFGASRGGRNHNGLDIVAQVNEGVTVPFKCKVTKYGYVYSGNMDFRYVEIQGFGLLKYVKIRLFYVRSLVAVGDVLERGDIVGAVQNIAGYHGGGMKNHIHVEIRINGALIDPAKVLKL